MPADADTLKLRGTADFGEPIGELAALQGAIDGLHGNRVKVTVDIDNVPSSIAGLHGVHAAADGAAAAHSRLARESDRAGRAGRRLGDDSEHAGRGMGRADESAQGLSRGLGGVGDNAGSAAARLRSMEAATEAVANAQQRALSATQRYENAYAKAFLDAPGKSVRERTMHAELATADLRVASEEAQVAYKHSEQAARDTRTNIKDTERESRQLGRTLRETGDSGAEAFLDLGGSSLRVGRVLGTVAGILPTVATGGAYAAAGMGLLTAGVAGLGAVSAGGLVAAGAGMVAAAKGATEWTHESLKDVQGFKESFENIDKAVKGYRAFIAEPFGAALVNMADESATIAPAIASPLRAVSREFADLLNQGTPADQTPGKEFLKESAMLAAQGMLQVTRGAMPAFQAGLRAMPPLLEAAIPPATALASAVGVRMNQALREGVPAFGDLMEAGADFGSKIAQIGAEEFAPTLKAVTSLTRGVTDMADQVRPAIGPSIEAVTDLGNAVTGGLGEAAPAAVTKFAQSVSRNAPGIRSLVSGVTRDAGMVGEQVADVLGALGPAVEQGMITGNGPHVAAGIGTFLEGMAPDWAVSASNAFDRAISNVLPNNQFGDFFRNQLGLRDWGGQGAGAGGGVASLGGIPIAAGQEAGGRELVPGRGITPGAWSGSQSQWAVVGGAGYRELPASQQARDVAGQPFPMGAGRISGGELVQINPHTRQPVSDIGGMQEWQQYRDDLEKAQPGTKTAEKNRAEQGLKYESAGNAPGQYVYEGTGGKRPEGAAPAGTRPPPGLAPGGPGQSVGPLSPQIAQLLNQEATAARQAGQAHQSYGNTVSAAQHQAANSTLNAAPQMQQQMSGAQQAVQQAQSTIPPAATTAFSAVNSAAAQVQPAPAVQAPMQHAVRAVEAGGADMATAGNSAGSNVMAAFIQGTVSEITKVDTVMIKHAKRIIEDFAGEMGISSPSTVFMGFGADTMRGYAGGVTNNIGLATSAMQKAAGQVVSTAQAGGMANVFAGLAPGGSLPTNALGGLSGYQPPPITPSGTPPGSEPGAGRGFGIGGYDSMNQMLEAQNAADAINNGPAKTIAERAAALRGRLSGRGWKPETVERVAQRFERFDKERGIDPLDPGKNKFTDYWTKKNEQANRNRYDAIDRAMHGSQVGFDAAPQLPAGHAPLSPSDMSSVGIRPPVMDFKEVLRVGKEIAAESAERAGRYGSLTLGVGKQASEGIAAGMKAGASAVSGAAADVASGLVDSAKNALGIKSPSREGAYIGEQAAAGIGLGVASGTASALGAVGLIANNAGLQAGYEYVKGFNGAMDHVIDRKNLEALARPQIESDQAEAWLGAMGLLGPAGSGAQVMKAPSVTIGGSSPTVQNHITIKVDLDGQHFRDYTLEQIDRAFEQAAEQYQGAFG